MANTKRKPTKGKPISSHPLFPAVVALWFGALFGLGSLAIRPTLIEGMVLKTGLDLVVPSAAPPLGVTARILIALIMASLGAAIGAALAVRLTQPKTVVRERKRTAAKPGAAAEAEAALWNSRNVYTDGPVFRPISAHEELGDALDSPGLLAGRRRALAVEHEERPFEPHEFAPLPGGEPQIFDISATRLAPVADLAPVAEAAQPEAPLDLGAFPAPAPVKPQAQHDWSAPSATPAQPPLIEREVPTLSEAPRIFGAPVEDDNVPVDFARATGVRTSVFEPEPVEPLFAAREAAQAAEARQAAPAPFAVDPLLAPEPAPADLGMTDLARRLQESMARRKAAKRQPAEAPPALPVAPEVAPVAAEPAFVPPPPIYNVAARQAALVPEIPPAPIPMPAALRPVSFDQHDEDDHADLSALMPRHLTMPAPTPVEEAVVEEVPAEASVEAEAALELEVEADADAVADDAFASLLSIEMPRQDFVRVEEPEEPASTIEPVVIFPGQMASANVAPLRPFDAPAAAMPGAPVAQAPAAPAVDPAEAERALRLALANLQRISGAA
ncbi:MAG: hypothetical protein U9R07_07995 [Pseudomonadota bacterium]|nr:hypothetical protein [Pseudomonadota bacterium]